MKNSESWSRIDPYLAGLLDTFEPCEFAAEHNNDMLAIMDIWMTETGNIEREKLKSRLKKRRSPKA